MKLESYTMPMAGKGWKPPAVRPRIQADGTYGGVVVHSSPGHIGDQMWRIPLPALKGKPKVSTVRTYTAETYNHALTANEAFAFYVNVAAGEFAAISVATMRLKRSADGAGTLSVEVWEKNASSLPEKKIGLLGAIDVASGLSTSYQDVTVWSNRHAWPFLGPNGGYLVLNGNGLTTGTVYWAGENTVANAHAEWNPATSTWSTVTGELSATVWQGADFLVLRGFQEAYCYPDGDGPQAWTLELDDGSQYSVKLREVEGQWGLEPLDVDHEGILVDAAIIFQPISEVGQQALGTT